MLSLLKFDLYKVFKSLGTWIIILCLVGFSIASLTIVYNMKTENNLGEIASEISEGTTAASLEEMSVVDWCIETVGGDFLMLFVLIFAVLFVCSDYTSGYIKNIYNTIRKKWQYILSKFVIVGLFVIISILIVYIVTILFNVIIVKSNDFGDASLLLKYSLNKALLLIAYGGVVMMVSFILRKATDSLIVCMAYSFMFVNLIYTGINQAVKYLNIAKDFDIQKYMLVGNAISLSTDITSQQQGIILIVSLLGILISFIISTMVFTKRDI